MSHRMIKDTIRTSKTVNAMTDFQFRAWLYLITYVDDYGRGSADAELLKGFVFPRLKRLRETDIERTLAELADMGAITIYTVDGDPFFCFPNWGAHQRIQTKKSKFPAPPAENAGEPPESAVSHGEPPSSTVNHGGSPPETKPKPKVVVVDACAREGEPEGAEAEPPETGPPPDIVAYCQTNLPAMNANAYQELADFMDNGITEEMVMLAVNATRDNGSMAWSYARAIMDSWVCKGIKTLEAAKTDNALFKARGQPRSRARDPTADSVESVYGGYVDIPPNGG